jgi:hypothetical protein
MVWERRVVSLEFTAHKIRSLIDAMNVLGPKGYLQFSTISPILSCDQLKCP